MDGDIPIIGVIKSKRNKERMKNIISADSLRNEEQIQYSNLINHPEIEIVHVDETNQTEIHSKLVKWIGDIEL